MATIAHHVDHVEHVEQVIACISFRAMELAPNVMNDISWIEVWNRSGPTLACLILSFSYPRTLVP